MTETRDSLAELDLEECTREHEISHATAQKLRQMLGDIQLRCMKRIPDPDGHEIVIFISERGFRLVDEMEGVIR